MKRILFVCCLLAFIGTVPFIHPATAQVPTITLADFTTKVNQLDAYIAAGNMPQANATADNLNQTMMIIAAKSKNDYFNATLPADKTKYNTINTNQWALYHDFLSLRASLTTNRTAIHTKLGSFGATIY